MKDSKYNNQRGFTLVEMLVSIALTSILIAAGFASITIVAKSINRTTLAKVLVEAKAAMVDSSLHPTALAYTISDPTNASMTCLRNQTDCAGATGGAFKLRNKKNELVYDSTLPTSGFGPNGEPCNSYNAAVSNPRCPFRYNLTWSPVCPTDGSLCDKPLIRIAGAFVGPGNTDVNRGNVNEERLSFSLMTASGTKDLPFVKKEMIYLNRGTTVTIDVLKNSWAGTTDGVLKLTAVSAASHGVTSVNSNGHLVYTPESTYHGLDSAVITVDSNHGETSTSVVWFKVMTPYTWTGDANDSQWSTARNWCGTANSSNTGCVGSATVPTNTHVAIFDGTCAGSCNARMELTSDTAIARVLGLKMTADFFGSLTTVMGVLRIGSESYIQDGGIFTAMNASSMTVTGSFFLNGGSFVAPSTVLAVNENVTISPAASFNANGGTFRFTNGAYGQKVKADSARFFNLDFANGNDNGWIDFQATTVNVDGDINFHPWPNHYCPQFSNGTINSFGNVTLSACGGAGSGLLVLKGRPGGQTITSSDGAGISNLQIDSGAHNVKFVGDVNIQQMNYTQASFTYVSSGTLDMTGGKLRFTGPGPGTSVKPGNMIYGDVSIENQGDGPGINLNGHTMKVAGTLTLAEKANHYCAEFRNGTFEALGDVEIKDCGAFGTGIIKLAGKAGGQTISGNGGGISNLVIDTGSNPVRFVGDVNVQSIHYGTASFKHLSSGDIKSGPGKLRFIGPTVHSIEPGNAVYGNVDIATVGDGGDVNLNGKVMKIEGKLRLAQEAYHYCINTNNGTLEARGDVEISNCGMLGDAVLKIAGGAGAQTITGISGGVNNMVIDAGSTPLNFVGPVRVTNQYKPASYKYISSGPISWAATSSLGFSGGNSFSVEPGSVDYLNVHFGNTGNLTLNNATMNITGDLNFVTGCGSVNTGFLKASGNVLIENVRDCGSGNVSLDFVGSKATTFNIVRGSPPTGAVSVTKVSGGSVRLLSELELRGSGQTLKVASGTLSGGCYGIDVRSVVTIDPGARLWDPGEFSYGSLVKNGTLGGCTASIPSPTPTPALPSDPEVPREPAAEPTPTPAPVYSSTACEEAIKGRTVDMTATLDMTISGQSSNQTVLTPLRNLTLTSNSGNAEVYSAINVPTISGLSGDLLLNANTIGAVSGVSGKLCLKAKSITSLAAGSNKTEIIAETIGTITGTSADIRIHGATVSKLSQSSGNICLLGGAKIIDVSGISGEVKYDCK